MEIIGRAFSPAGLKAYVAGLNLKAAAPWAKFAVRHNTGAPTLAQRPIGFSAQHIRNLKGYYEGLGWHAGPHLFVDDRRIWVFSPLTKPGVHTPSWNGCSFGVEQLGDFGPEDYNSGRGLAVQRNAVAAVAVLCWGAGIDSHSLRDHHEDPGTTHRDCPGKTCAAGKARFMDDVHDYIVGTLNKSAGGLT